MPHIIDGNNFFGTNKIIGLNTMVFFLEVDKLLSFNYSHLNDKFGNMNAFNTSRMEAKCLANVYSIIRYSFEKHPREKRIMLNTFQKGR